MAKKAARKKKGGRTLAIRSILKKSATKTATKSVVSKAVVNFKNPFLNCSEDPLSTSTPKKLLVKVQNLSNRTIKFSNITLNRPNSTVQNTRLSSEGVSHKSLFDSSGYVNNGLLTYYRNQISDRIYSSDLIKEKMSFKMREIENQVKDFGKWIKLIDDMDYIKLDLTCPKSEKYIKQSEATLNDIRDMLNEVDIFYSIIDQAMDDVECDRNFLRNLEFFIVSSVHGYERWGKVSRGLNSYVLNSLSIVEQPAGARIMSFQKLCSIAECSSEYTLFLDLKWNGSIQARIHLRAVDNDNNVSFCKLKRNLFQGEPAPFVKGAKLESLILQNSSSSVYMQENSDSSDVFNDQNFLMESTNYGGCKFHLLHSIVGLDPASILEVTKGGYVLRLIMQSKFYKSVTIDECGIIMFDQCV